MEGRKTEGEEKPLKRSLAPAKASTLLRTFEPQAIGQALLGMLAPFLFSQCFVKEQAA